MRASVSVIAPPDAPRRSTWSAAGTPSTKEVEIDRVGHRLVAGGAGVQVVAAVVGRLEPQRVGRVLGRLGEVDEPVEVPGRLDPGVELLPLLLQRRRVPG